MFTQSGGIGTITWSLTGTLPTGLSFNAATATLSGTPTQTGTFSITVKATDANGCVGTRTYSLVIDCQTITVNPATVPAGTAGAPYSQVFTQSGGIGTITWALTGTLPTGLSFNAATATLSGTPTQTGTFSITVTATDANGCVGTRDLLAGDQLPDDHGQPGDGSCWNGRDRLLAGLHADCRHWNNHLGADGHAADGDVVQRGHGHAVRHADADGHFLHHRHRH